MFAFMGPPPAYRPPKPEKPEQPKQPKITRMSQSVTLRTGTFWQKVWLATCVIVLMVGLVVFGIFASVFQFLISVFK